MFISKELRAVPGIVVLDGNSQEVPESKGTKAAGCLLKPHTLLGKLCYGEEASLHNPVFFKFNGLYPITKFKTTLKPRSVLQAAPWALCCLFGVKSQCKFCTPCIPTLISVPCRIQVEDVSLKALSKLIHLLNSQLCPR